MDSDISNNANIKMSKTNFNVNDRQLDYNGETGELSIKPIYLEKDKNGNVVITGNMIVEGEKSIVNTAEVQVEDKNIELGFTRDAEGNKTYNDITANGGGITLKGDTDKTIIWEMGPMTGLESRWVSNQDWDIKKNDGKYKINNDTVLTKDTLGYNIRTSSLEVVGTIKEGIWEGTDIDINRTTLPKHLHESLTWKNKKLRATEGYFLRRFTDQTKQGDIGMVAYPNKDLIFSIFNNSLTNEPVFKIGKDEQRYWKIFMKKDTDQLAFSFPKTNAKTLIMDGKTNNIGIGSFITPLHTVHVTGDMLVSDKIITPNIDISNAYINDGIFMLRAAQNKKEKWFSISRDNKDISIDGNSGIEISGNNVVAGGIWKWTGQDHTINTHLNIKNKLIVGEKNSWSENNHSILKFTELRETNFKKGFYIDFDPVKDYSAQLKEQGDILVRKDGLIRPVSMSGHIKINNEGVTRIENKTIVNDLISDTAKIQMKKTNLNVDMEQITYDGEKGSIRINDIYVRNTGDEMTGNLTIKNNTDNAEFSIYSNGLQGFTTGRYQPRVILGKDMADSWIQYYDIEENQFTIKKRYSNDESLSLQNNGNVGIGKKKSSIIEEKLHVFGNIKSTAEIKSTTASISTSINTPIVNINKEFNFIIPANNFNKKYFTISKDNNDEILSITDKKYFF